MSDDAAPRRVEVGDVLLALFLMAYAAVSISVIPFDFQDLSYLFSLEQGRWVMQEWVHPIYVPVLDLFRGALGLVGYEGPMLVPVELLNVGAATVAFLLLYRLTRRFPGSTLAAAVALGMAALSHGFWFAAVRPTPYALAFLYQTLSLLLLIAESPVPSSRYALAGALAGVSMGFHASAMALGVVAVVSALCEPDAERTLKATFVRIVSFAGALLASAIACWAVLVRYRGIGIDFFRNQELHSTFLAIEQMPGSSIYTSRSLIEQLSTFATTLRWQAGGLLPAAVVSCLAVAVLRRRAGVGLSPFERRLAIVAAANFAAFAGFFLINNTHNGFIFASLTLVPVVLAVLVRDSRILLVLLLALSLPDSIRNVREMYTGPQGRNDPLLIEVGFLQKLLGPRDVLLTPGTPFPESLYLAHLNMFELSTDTATHPSPEVPVVHPGAELRARIGWWRDNGGRVFYALGDGSTDFAGDVTGAEKARQVFWRPETAAAERAPRLRALRAALESSGIEFRDGVTSPNEERYAEIRASESPPLLEPPPPAPLSVRPDELRTLFLNDQGDAAAPYRAQRASYLAQLAKALPDDPWHACDIMQLVCAGRPRRSGQLIPCAQSARCADHSGGADAGTGDARGAHDNREQGATSCFWGKLSSEAEEQVVERYLAAWVEKNHLGRLSDWGFRASGQSADMRMVVADGTLTLSWQLSDSCVPGVVTATPADGIAADAVSAEQLQQLVAGLPIPTVRAAVARYDEAERR